MTKWSFSKLQAYDTCPYMFRLNYIEHTEQEPNAFAQYGTFCHSLLEQHNKGEISAEELADKYILEYGNNITVPFPDIPPNMAERYMTAGLNYFRNYKGFAPYKVIGVEQDFEMTLDNGDIFKGIIDLILQNPYDNSYVIVDHKSKSEYGMIKDFDKYIKQLYIYSAYIKNTYGIYPDKLVFNMFRSGSFITEQFSLARFQKVMEWLYNTIDLINSAKDFPYKENEYFCQNVCSFRSICPSHQSKQKFKPP